MKTFLSITLLLLLATVSKSQDASLPTGKSRIFLYSGKIIKNARLWSVDSVKAEYVLNGNLADFKISEIQKIETDDYVLTFNEKNQQVKNPYDFIFLKSGDTVRCFIQQTSEWYITYLAVETGKLKSIGKSSYNSYYQNPKLTVVNKIDSSAFQKKDTVVQIALSDTTSDYYAQDTSKKYWNGILISDTNFFNQKKVAKTDSKVVPKEEEKNYYEMGKKDGEKYYNGTGNAIGAFTCGLIPIYGWLGGIVLFATPPPYNSWNPNKELIYTNEDYKKGYKESAGKKKRQKVAAGFTLGLGTLLVLAFGLR